MHDIAQQTDREPGRRYRLHRVASMAAAVLAVGVALGACGGTSAPGVATGSTTTITTSSSAGVGAHATGLLAYASCMRSHGVPNFPDPGGKGGIPKPALVAALKDVSSAQAQAASNDCKGLLPAGGLSGQPVVPVPAQDQQDYLRAVACLRAHGFPNFPDPVFSGGSVHFSVPTSINTASAQFAAARQICQRLIPAGLPDSGSGR